MPPHSSIPFPHRKYPSADAKIPRYTIPVIAVSGTFKPVGLLKTSIRERGKMKRSPHAIVSTTPFTADPAILSKKTVYTVHDAAAPNARRFPDTLEYWENCPP